MGQLDKDEVLGNFDHSTRNEVSGSAILFLNFLRLEKLHFSHFFIAEVHFQDSDVLETIADLVTSLIFIGAIDIESQGIVDSAYEVVFLDQEDGEMGGDWGLFVLDEIDDFFLVVDI